MILRHPISGESPGVVCAVVFNRKVKPAVSQAAQVPSVAEPPPADNFVGDPDALRLRDELAAGRWQDAHEFLESVRDWRLRNFYVSALASVPGRPEWIDEWVAGARGVASAMIPAVSSGTVDSRAVRETAQALYDQLIVVTPSGIPAVQGRMGTLPPARLAR
jgi:hypothetical protein